jgi:hypothetical protein
MGDEEVLKSLATNVLCITLQRAEEVFPALKQSSVSVMHRKVIYQLFFLLLR